MHFLKIASTGGILMLSGGCASTLLDSTSPAETWPAIQERFAQLLAKADNGVGFRYRPITEPVWSMGAVFDNGAVFPKTSCPFEIGDFHRFEFSTPPSDVIGLDAALKGHFPPDLARVLSFVRLKMNFHDANTLSLQYTDLKLDYVDNDALIRRAGDDQCFTSVDDFRVNPKVIIRGQVRGKLKVTSRRGFDAGSVISATNHGDYRVRFDAASGFEISENVERVRFLVRSEIKAHEIDLKVIKEMTQYELLKYLKNLGFRRFLAGDTRESVSVVAELGQIYEGKVVLPLITNPP